MKIKSKCLFVCFCIVVGFLMATQMQISKGQKLYVSPKIMDEYQVAIESEKQSIFQIEERILETEKKLREYEKLAAEDNDADILAEMQEKRDNYKLVSHSTKVRGQGISIYLDDATRDLLEEEPVGNVLVHDSDLLTILNDLFASGAEAVSVNGHRIANGSAISCSGYTVRINGQFEARPFRIKAIGSADRLSSALLGLDGYGTLLKDYGLIFKVVIEDKLEIPSFPEERRYQYMTIWKEGESN